MGNTNVSYSMQNPSTCPLTLSNRFSFQTLTVPNPTDSLGEVKVSQHIYAGKCEVNNNDDDDDDDNNNNNNGSRGMGEVGPLYGVDPALVLTNPGVQ